ncbi:tRNA (N6-adenosine(37)-N6)-threonylcarbamoyltransferase complex ATPase TsaE [Syntrophotalea acetylenivorans]|uniref:tRNA threonylcarbamoyladenosine biosynthesis protein TsaE n=1 Tax=Syntrophotalea acetylenivorans TaxID=1842532 RepID=A0A1L3GNC7_9BACT|nr:tRNA (adenosine(37)-N6)-threonylcarbamoyltransferase complex ATPase subunit type 1 TsaE [Syntrophotalea acetylenivorans]APG27437.1 tRNA (N6-adenosine(37)-N6)-threonylcarbamoyltransferase complex ATPase TsaE [Syntrophotalea acetylenivorans]
MSVWSLSTSSEEETGRLGRCLGRLIEQPLVILLSGDLGAGKTCFSRGLARGLGVPEEVPVASPSYTLMNAYTGRLELYHFDLYRLAEPEDLLELGMEEYLPGDGVAIVEWADLFTGLAREYLAVHLSHEQADQRRIECRAAGAGPLALMQKWQGEWLSQAGDND